MKRLASLCGAACVILMCGCATTSQDLHDEFDVSNRASEDIAPANPNRRQKTVKVVTTVPSELEVKLVTFYTQFAHKKRSDGYVDFGSGSRTEGCYRVERSLLATLMPMTPSTQVSYYNRVFYIPVDEGLQTHTILLDEVLPGKCGIRASSIGYSVKYKASGIKSPSRYVNRVEILVSESGSLTPPKVVVNCTHVKPAAEKIGNDTFLQCSRVRANDTDFFVGPVSTSGAQLQLDFRYVQVP